MNARLSQFLRLVSVLHGRTSEECRAIVGMPRSTLRRYITIARSLGMRIECSWPDYRYRVTDPGPFDLRRLQRGLAGEPEPALPRVASRPYATGLAAW